MARPVPLLAPACSSSVLPGLGGQCLSCQGFPPPWPSWPGLLAGNSEGGEGRTGKWVPRRARWGAWWGGGGEERSHSGFHPTSPSERVAAGPSAQARGSTPPGQHSVPWGWTLVGEGGMDRFRGLGLGAGGQRPLEERRGPSEPGTWSNLKSWWYPRADSLVGTSGEPALHIPLHLGSVGLGGGFCHRARGQLRVAGGAGGGSGRSLSTLTSVINTRSICLGSLAPPNVGTGMGGGILAATGEDLMLGLKEL